MNKNKMYNIPPSVILQDKRDYCLSSLQIKDTNIRKVVDICDLLIKSVDTIYDSIISNKEVTLDVNRHLDILKQHIDNLMEDLHE